MTECKDRLTREFQGKLRDKSVELKTKTDEVVNLRKDIEDLTRECRAEFENNRRAHDEELARLRLKNEQNLETAKNNHKLQLVAERERHAGELELTIARLTGKMTEQKKIHVEEMNLANRKMDELRQQIEDYVNEIREISEQREAEKSQHERETSKIIRRYLDLLEQARLEREAEQDKCVTLFDDITRQYEDDVAIARVRVASNAIRSKGWVCNRICIARNSIALVFLFVFVNEFALL